jgi:hypothetical protein
MEVKVKDNAETSRLLRKFNEILAQEESLEPLQYRVILYVSTRTNFDEPIHMSQMEMALELRKWKTHISRAVKGLVDLGILIPSDKGVRASEWRLNLDHKVKKSAVMEKAKR